MNIVRHKLPGHISGRGALQATFGNGDEQLLVLSVHLALGQQTRIKQLEYICNILRQYRYFVIMGDMNCPVNKAAEEFAKSGLRVKHGDNTEATFPRWEPKYRYDHIWVSSNLKVIKSSVMQLGVSDHLPISMEIENPDSLNQLN